MSPAELAEITWRLLAERCAEKGYTADMRRVVVLHPDDDPPAWLPLDVEVWRTHESDARSLAVNAKDPIELEPGGFPTVWTEQVWGLDVLFPVAETVDN